MAMTISNHPLTLALERQLESSQNDVQQATERIASGNRLVRAGDDPAAFALSLHLEGEIRGNEQARKTALDAGSLAQVAQGGLNTISDLLVRLRELAIQSASDTLGDDERGLLAIEAEEVKAEINRTARTSEFHGQRLLDGSTPSLTFQIGTDGSETSRLEYPGATFDARGSSLGIDGVDVSDADSARDALEDIDRGFDQLNTMRATLGAFQSRLDLVTNSLAVKNENLSASLSTLEDADLAQESANLVNARIRSQVTVALLAQANQHAEQVLKLIGG